MGGMDEQHIERMPAEEVQGWLPYYAKVEFEGRGFPVAHILPPEYECYLRLFHPLSLSSEGVLSDPRTWRSVAEDAGLTFQRRSVEDRLVVGANRGGELLGPDVGVGLSDPIGLRRLGERDAEVRIHICIPAVGVF
jgi:hypothetical protein